MIKSTAKILKAGGEHLPWLGVTSRHFVSISPIKKEKYEQVVLSCFFVLFLFNVIVFVYNRLKWSLILQIKPNCFYRFLLFTRFLCLLLKKYLVLYIETWVRVCCYIHHLCLHVLFCFANLRYQGDIPCLTRTKSWWRLYIFLKPRSMKNQYFKLTC